MTTLQSTTLDEASVEGASPWLLLSRDELRRPAGKPLLRSSADGVEHEVRHMGGSLWIVTTWPSGARVAFLAAHAPGGTAGLAVESREGNTLVARLETVVGVQEVRVDLPSGKRRTLRWRTTLRPTTDLIFPFWPRDVVPLDAEGDPLGARGLVHAAQRGAQGGLLYASLTRPGPGTFLYAQNLTELNDYCEATKTSPADRVSGEWPELGYSPPTADKPLAAGVEVVISDAYVATAPDNPADDLAAASAFLDLYSEIYLEFPRPRPVYRDWPRRVRETLRTLTHSPECYVEKQGRRFMLAYVGADDRPPESMVQLAVLVPLVEYARSRGEIIPLIDALRDNLSAFYDERLGTMVRWLPGEEKLLEGREEHMGPFIMDSWYLHHTLQNLGRLAVMEDAEAKRLFLASIDYAIRVARRFEYRWPVFYDMRTLEVLKAETAPGAGGEHDVAAQYAHLMMLAHELTDDRAYLDEAATAARTLHGLGFRLGYQANNTAFGAGALLRLWRETGDDEFRDLSLVCLANLVRNLWLWECKYGHADSYSTFLGLPPLQDAPYLAIYEEFEALAAFHEYLDAAGDDVHPGARILLPEYCKYLLDRAWHHYPSELPTEGLAESPTSGHLDPQLSIPVEDISEGWTKAGTVGQEVYGASAPLVFSTRHCFLVGEGGLVIRCDYPALMDHLEGDESRGKARFRVLGDPRLACDVRLVADHTNALPEVELKIKGGRRRVEGKLVDFGGLAFELPGDAEVSLSWRAPEALGEQAGDAGKGEGQGSREKKARAEAKGGKKGRD
ncbi:hypothetical protein [Paludisphaera sp.]|uniref:hypothetical protein n=1 Tax=Paludisphaera sp. TaxID=2017432 RepID=UPI00301DEEEB